MRKPVIAVVLIAGAAGLLWRNAQRTGKELRGLDSVTVPEGFTVELASAPGLVNYPMLGTLDDRGRLFLCESSGKTVKTPEMTADPTYAVSLIEDTNGDGVFDKSTTFADKLTLPAGAVWHRGSLYVAAPPVLYRFEDTNGDGVAEVREKLVEGWNLSANAASLHGPFFGPDGWLYLTDGRHGFNIKTKDGREYAGKASRIWRVRPDGTGLEVYAGGGFDNPVEVVFTEGGDMFGTMTYFQDPADGQRDAILHFVEGGVYPKPHPTTVEFKRTGDLMPVMTKFARIAPSGLERYRGTSFGAAYQGNLFTAQFNAHRVQRHIVSRQGATYRTKDEDFFVASDPDMHPTDVMEDADGSLIVVDTGAWFIHGCPLSRAPKPDIKGALYRVRKKGAASVADPRGLKIARLEASHLDDPRPAVVDRAVETLVADKVPVRVAQAKTVRGASAAVFASARMGDLAAVREALKDARAEVRQAAARQLGMARDRESVAALAAMVKKEDPGVRRQAAAALGAIGDRAAVAALLEAAANPEDRFVEHSVILALIDLKDGATLAANLGGAPANVRRAALIALDQMDNSPLRDAQALPFLSDPDPALRRAGFWVVSRHPAWSAKVVAALEARVRAPQFSEQEGESLAETIGSLCGEAQLRTSIAGTLGDASLDAERQLFLLGAAERCSSKEFPAEWTAPLSKLLEHADARVRLRAVNLARARGVATLDAELRAVADSARQPDEVRIAALSALGSRTPKIADADLDYLLSRLAPAVEANAKLAAAQVLGRGEYTDEQLIAIAQHHMKKVDPLVLPNLIDAFRNARSEAVGRALVRALTDTGESLGTVGAQRVKDLMTKFPASTQEQARVLLARLDKDKDARMEKVRKLSSVATAAGNAAKGREIFFGSKAGCSSCHTIGLEGGHVGPDLTSIGAIRAPVDLLEAIVLPSESFVPGHEVYRVETAREMYSGLMGKPTPDAVLLITGPNDEVRIPRKDVVKMGYAPVSLMPEGFDEVLSKGELTDLMAFLRGQTARPNSSD